MHLFIHPTNTSEHLLSFRYCASENNKKLMVKPRATKTQAPVENVTSISQVRCEIKKHLEVQSSSYNIREIGKTNKCFH